MNVGLDAEAAAKTAKMLADMSSSIPGIDEAIAFNELMQRVRKQHFDVIVFDTAPTGKIHLNAFKCCL